MSYVYSENDSIDLDCFWRFTSSFSMSFYIVLLIAK